MKILHVVSSLNVGGAERFVIDLAAEQNKQGQHATILSMGSKGEPLESEIKRFGLGLFHGTKIKILRSYLSLFDVVHVHSSYSLLRVLLASLMLPVKVVYTRHNERVHNSFKWRLIYQLARFRLHKMVFVAEKARKNYLAFYPSLEKKSCTVLNGVLPMTQNKTNSDKLRIAHVGRFVRLKAQHILIEAIAKIPLKLQEKLSLSFFGTGDLLAHNQKLANELIPNVEVNFKGFVTNRDEIYGESDLLVVTSETEGLSLAILEALASGTPTIASNVGGNPELIHHQVNGLLYSYGDIKELAEQIKSLIDNKIIYQEYSMQCIDIFKESFSMAICAENYQKTYL
ncbi:glycosyltransferase family 4 protein [Thalassotalea profundi]|uniref:Glycosyl transferase n=1 Tax=Thalassotalea profundi TaxID=2036687 RepID=A0ABQ3IQP0_9GAMM|nr:glycosyltransferase family 4 protein [Thalassotalea profundi]GHE89411.1 glycosyl transferase [Thalassotalea profundi]